MTDEEEIALAKKLPKGSRACLMRLTEAYRLPGQRTFNANAAFNLAWVARSYGGLAESTVTGKRRAYRITPLGQRIRARLYELRKQP